MGKKVLKVKIGANQFSREEEASPKDSDKGVKEERIVEEKSERGFDSSIIKTPVSIGKSNIFFSENLQHYPPIEFFIENNALYTGKEEIPVKSTHVDKDINLFYTYKIDVEDPLENPSTISKFWISIDKLESAHADKSRLIENIGKLKSHFNVAAWKKIKNDNNSYYRAIGSRYFEYIHKIYSPVHMIEQLKYKLLTSCANCFDNQELEIAKDYIIDYLEYVIRNKKEGNCLDLFISAVKLLQNEEFERKLIMTLKLLVANVFLEHFQENESMVNSNNYIQNIISMDKDSSDFIMEILPQALEIGVTLFTNLEDEMTEKEFPKNMLYLYKFLVIKQEKKYYVLCDSQEIELDCINLYENTYSLSSQFAYYKSFINEIKKLK